MTTPDTLEDFIEKLTDWWRTENGRQVPGATPPTVDELRAWRKVAPDEASKECSDRIKAIRDHLPALPQPFDVEDIHALWLEATRFQHPLAQFVTTWLERPRLVGIDAAADRLPVGVAQVNEGNKRGSVRSFSLPSRIEAQADGQQVTLASRDFTLCKNPRLPEEFLAIGQVDGNKGGASRERCNESYDCWACVAPARYAKRELQGRGATLIEPRVCRKSGHPTWKALGIVHVAGITDAR